MKVYHPVTGEVYEGEPVDCRELMQVGGYVKEVPGSVKVTDLGRQTDAPTQEELDEALSRLPAQVKSGVAKDAEVTVTSMKLRYGVLFTADNEASVRALFPSAGKSADQTPGRSAKVSGRG